MPDPAAKVPADVSLIVPNYNGRALLERNLPAVQR